MMRCHLWQFTKRMWLPSWHSFAWQALKEASCHTVSYSAESRSQDVSSQQLWTQGLAQLWQGTGGQFSPCATLRRLRPGLMPWMQPVRYLGCSNSAKFTGTPDHRSYEVINICCFKLLSFRVMCYTAIEN